MNVSGQLVSVIMPVYNGSAFIAEAIESVLVQTHKNLELIIVNDGSVDSTEIIIHKFDDERIKYYYTKNTGQATASNFGIEKATGEYIKFFDADDVMNETHIEHQLLATNGDQNNIASCDWGRFYHADPEHATFTEDIVREALPPIEWLKKTLSKPADMMAAWLWLIPRQVINNAGGWNTSLSLNNDFEFSVRLLLHSTKVVHATNAKMYYRSGVTGSLSKKISEDAFYDAFLSTDLGCRHLLQADNSAEMKKICADRYQIWVHRIYPKHPDLLKKFEQQIEMLGGSNLPLASGRLLKILEALVGWKIAKRTKYWVYQILNKKDDLSCLPT